MNTVWKIPRVFFFFICKWHKEVCKHRTQYVCECINYAMLNQQLHLPHKNIHHVFMMKAFFSKFFLNLFESMK